MLSHSFRDISTSGLAAISGCRSLLESPRGTFFELVVVENPRFPLDACRLYESTSALNFAQCQNNLCLTSCLTTSGAPIDDLIFVSCALFIYRKSHKTASRKPKPHFVNDALQKPSWGILTSAWFLRATAYAVSAHMLSQFRPSVCLSVCLSVRLFVHHTGGSVKNG